MPVVSFVGKTRQIPDKGAGIQKREEQGISGSVLAFAADLFALEVGMGLETGGAGAFVEQVVGLAPACDDDRRLAGIQHLGIEQHASRCPFVPFQYRISRSAAGIAYAFFLAFAIPGHKNLLHQDVVDWNAGIQCFNRAVDACGFRFFLGTAILREEELCCVLFCRHDRVPELG